VNAYDRLVPQISCRVVFTCGGSLKDKVRKRNPHKLLELEENIREEISRISPAELQGVNQKHNVHTQLNVIQWMGTECSVQHREN
jgi:hypothetical protein